MGTSAVDGGCRHTVSARTTPASRTGCLLFLTCSLPVVLFACRLSTRPNPGAAVARVPPSDSLVLAVPSVAIAADADGLLVLDMDGSRIVRLDDALRPADSFVLNPKVVGARGMLADRFYLYIFDDNRLYRVIRSERRMETWLNNVRVSGVAGYAPGELVVSEAGLGSIWHKTLFMQSRRLTTRSEVREPGALTALPGGGFAVLSGSESLIEMDRLGIVVRRRSRPTGADLIESDTGGVLYLMQRGAAMLWCITQHGSSQYQLASVQSPVDMAVVGSYLVVLDGANRLARFRLPLQ